jgi:SAM-dependent methyltransferase
VFDEGDCQVLPYPDASFDAAASTFGLVFASSHERAAQELARVCRSGARIAVTSWTFDAWSELGARAGRPDLEGDDARLWSRADYVRALLGGVFDLRFQRAEWAVVADSGEELWQLLATSVPPLKAWLDSLDPVARDRAEDVYREFLSGGELRREYVLILGSRR